MIAIWMGILPCALNEGGARVQANPPCAPLAKGGIYAPVPDSPAPGSHPEMKPPLIRGVGGILSYLPLILAFN